MFAVRIFFWFYFVCSVSFSNAKVLASPSLNLHHHNSAVWWSSYWTTGWNNNSSSQNSLPLQNDALLQTDKHYPDALCQQCVSL